MKAILVGCTALSFMGLSGCDNKPAASKKDGHSDTDGHDHGKQANHTKDDGHDHSAHDGHGHNESEKKALGTMKIGAFKVTVAQEAPVTAGKAGSFHMKVTGGRVNAVRTWIGTQDASGSVKFKAEVEGADFHAHPKAPNPLPNGSLLWIELEAEDGTKLVGSTGYQ